MKILILHNAVLRNDPDEMDVIAQRDLVKEVCSHLGYTVTTLAMGKDLDGDLESVRQQAPDLVFNLCEAAYGKGELIYFAPAMLNALKIPYTGVPLEALFLTSSKVLAKKIMRLHALPTADYFTPGDVAQLDPAKNYIVKPVWEEASLGISADSIFRSGDTQKTEKIRRLSARHYFIEEYIDGREFNISMLAAKDGVEILPPAEMLFGEYFDDKPRILGYQAKWDENSPEYRHSRRAFRTLQPGSVLEKALRDTCLKCWDVFGLRAYARVDLRVDKDARIYILEINGNPCIAPDSGFVAALHEAGYENETMIERIIEDAE
ncbi:MAG: D-alanine--D-alanine ligase [Candidatus Neomarinimicrobiota bacterium]|jgi:D-alanine-D-alanine ligase|nr:D-alanine--D-alanine ligase [Candidatus Neomarinimicrobiota bacterium]MDX9779419.1 D-alanine--D-alanine ligase [bacterium]